MEQSNPDSWDTPQKILVILAHPDDPEFFCGATLAKWAHVGHDIHYCLLTCGDKGSSNPETSTEALCSERVNEQKAAAEVLGVKEVRFLGYSDGYVIPDLEMRKDIVRIIRQVRPDIVVTSDPLNLFPAGIRINHPDHRAAGQVVLDSIFPASQNPLYFKELLTEEGLEPHQVREVWISLTHEPNVTLDVTDFWETKIRALCMHKSQIGDPGSFIERMKSRHTSDSSLENPRYEEYFRRLVLV